jgi:peptide chain release factor 1
VHTSTVTVAVINSEIVSRPEYTQRDKSDFKIEWFSGTGAGGQNRNKVQNSCRIIHLPTGISQTAQTRSRQNSQQEAMSRLIEQLNYLIENETYSTIASDRKQLVGSGQRGDKIRTYRFQANQVKDHRTNKTAPCDRIMQGQFDLLW